MYRANPKVNIRTLALTLFLSYLILLRSFAAEEKGERLFQETLRLYKTLISDPVKVNDYEIWDTIAQAFYSVYRSYPNSPKAPDSLFLSGKMYEDMGNRFNSREDFRNSIERCREFIRVFPKSNLADDAQIRIARILELEDKSRAYIEYEKVIKDFPNGDMAYAAREKLKKLRADKTVKNQSDKPLSNSKLAKVTEIRHWSTDTYTRVVIQVNKEIPFESHFLKSDPIEGTPPRLYVDIKNSTIDRNLNLPPIENGLLERIRFARNTLDTVRVVLDIVSFKNYKVFALYDPFRIVMDIYGSETKEDVFVKQKDYGEDRTLASLPKLDGKDISTLRGALGLKVRTVVIDPGHGGHDPGAIGPTGLKEKDVTLAIAKALKRKIEREGREFGISRVVLTRETDRFIPLEERTAIARKENADLFISIHCNAARDKHAFGIETYILSFTKDPEALAVAARENATTTKSISDLEDIIKKYLLSSKINESTRLASHVQDSIMNRVTRRYELVKNKGVKKAPFIVLIGADVPSILVETSFITNPREEERLRDDEYINEIAHGIFAGIKKYSNEVETAFLTE
jgi:N-acetylmuramoyl-L-alanine amidase